MFDVVIFHLRFPVHWLLQPLIHCVCVLSVNNGRFPFSIYIHGPVSLNAQGYICKNNVEQVSYNKVCVMQISFSMLYVLILNAR
jgi:hypothetical protein